MEIMRYIRKLIDPLHRLQWMAKNGLYDYMNDEAFVRKLYSVKFGHAIDLACPKTFNEKLQWLKLHDRNPEYTRMVDKSEAKKWAAERIGNEYIIPTLGVYTDFDDIDFAKLPQQFVLKCTHDSGSTVVVRDKEALDRNKVKRKLKKSLRYNYYKIGREWPYKNVTPRIIAEAYLEEDNGYNLFLGGGSGASTHTNDKDIRDYKFLCFNGTVKCCFVCTGRHSKEGLHITFFDQNWNVMPFERHYPSVKAGLPKPVLYDKMVELAQALSKGIPFVRVDLYAVGTKIYFGEMTFYPGSGLEEFTPEEWDRTLGDWIDISL